MATYTPNLNLKKPASTDLVSIADINGNMDALDTAVAGKLDKTGGNVKGTIAVRNAADTGNVASIDQNGYVTGTWLRTTGASNLNATPSQIPVLSNGWIYYRTLEQMKSDLGGGGGAEIHSNLSASSWTADSTYSDFPYRCALAITGVTAADVAEVVFNQSEAASGNYASVCETYAGGVYIYSSVNTAITIPTVLIHKG